MKYDFLATKVSDFIINKFQQKQHFISIFANNLNIFNKSIINEDISD